VLTNTGNIITLILLNPRLMHRFFSPEKQSLLRKPINNKIGFSLLLSHSLILNEDQYWKDKRKLFADILNFDFVKSKTGEIGTISMKNIRGLEEKNEPEIKEEHRVFSIQIKETFESIVS
jgi:hypothetical protein